TPFGMTALLPLDSEPMTIGFKGTQVTIQQQGSGPELAERQGRKAFLKATLLSAGNKSLVECVDMEELLSGASVPPARLVAVFDNTIDEQGEKGTEGLAPRSQQFIANIKRTIERLHAAGVDTVQLVTDHGFLLLPGE